MARNKGAEGQGDTKSISWREERKKSQTKKKKSAPKNEIGALNTVTVTVQDFLSGHAMTGHRIAIGDAEFELKKDTLSLVKSNDKRLAPFVDRMQYVFVTEGQITNNAFESPLSHTAREKQMAMWTHIRTVIGEEGRMALLKRREMSRLATVDKPSVPLIEAAAPEKEGPTFVAENAKRWNEASAEIATAFESMSAEKPAEIRIGTNQHEGAAFGFFYVNGSIRIYAGHVGAKSLLAGKMLDGVYLEARRGQLSETISDALNGTVIGKSVFAMHGFMMGLPRNLRDPIMSGMSNAVRRIQKPAQPSHPPTLHVVKSSVAELPQKAAVPPAQPAKDGLQELVSALVKSGAAPEVIAQAAIAYQATQASAAHGTAAA